ncbi:zwei Ig domain protein zig-8-like [Frankliniella occidentalis]|uniref:Zwei Ig domain protein zig-8-like n=1 Tax=Frankliniella occidentalis TaxID=133901 RepID=A0A6J1TBF6_FRAOC|nr:zwei Ig domain protein zig-8-like [Frankliniella occidentalis]
MPSRLAVAAIALVLSYNTVWSAQRDNENAGSGSADGNALGEDADKGDKLLDPWAPPTPGPYFDMDGRSNVTALLGKTAFLNCRVRRLGNKTVSWVRHRDTHLLTVGLYTYTNDQRFRAQHGSGDDWVLQLKYPQHRDAGTYECQVSTTPHMSHLVNLTVVEPSSEILGGPDLYIDRGSTINLTCIVLNSPEPPAYVIWNHNDAIISYDSPRGGVSVVTEKGVTTESFLLIQSARPSDSGRYTCNPSNAQAKGINVHVLNGEHPAAMQHAGQAHHQSSHFYCLVFCVCLLLLAP